jgi:competence protein ComEC
MGASATGPLVIGAAAAGIATGVVLLRRGRAGAAALAIGLSTVALRIAIGALLAGPAVSSEAVAIGAGEWQATVIDLGAPSGMEQRGFLRLTPRPGDGDPGRGGSFIAYGRLPRHPAIVPGDIVVVAGVLEARPDDGSGFDGYLERAGAIGSLRARSMRLVGRGAGALAAVERLRWGIDGAMSRVLPEPEAGLAAGILIGLRERVGREVAADFMVTGLTHVVAISGWNIALVAGIATSLLRATGLGRRSRSAVVLVAIIGYTVIAGAEASVIRAAAMGGVVLLAREGGRPSGAAAALGVVAWGLLLTEPAMIEDIGLQLSLAATAGLLVLGAPATAAVRRVTRGHAPRWFEETLGISLAAQLSTLPLILLHFGRLSLISPLANLLVAPVVPLAMLGAVIALAVAPLLLAPPIHLLLLPVTFAAWLPLAAMVRGAEVLATVPFANLELASPLDLTGAGLALVILMAALRATRRRERSPTRHPLDVAHEPRDSAQATRGRQHRRRLVVAVIGSALVISSATILLAPPSGILRVTILDVGQGDAILLEGQDGTRLLVDGGPDPDLLVRRLDERVPIWDRHIDMAIVTHPHEDHAGGLAGLTPRYRLDILGETGLPSESPGITQLRTSLPGMGVARVRLTQGDVLDLDGARVEVAWPPRHAISDGPAPTSGRVINDTSIVLVVTIGEQRILLTGDIEDDRDEALLEYLRPTHGRWDLLKVAHHGSATASSRPLLEALRPQVAVVSSGTGNTYGHPARATLGRLRDVGSTVRRTDLDGSISLAFDGRRRGTASILPAKHGVASRPRCPAPADNDGTPATRTSPPCYARSDGVADPNRSPFAPRVRLAVSETAATRHGRRRGRRLPCPARVTGGSVGRPSFGRDSRAPPRYRQGPSQ